jgi:hypothetical protein
MDLSKEEILGNIQRLNAQRKEKRSKLSSAREQLKDRDEQLSAFEELKTAVANVKIIGAKLNDQRDADETWQNYMNGMKDAQADLDAIEDSLSEMLLLYMMKTKRKAVHADPDEPTEVDREIKTVARLGKKVPANVSLFDEPEKTENDE